MWAILSSFAVNLIIFAQRNLKLQRKVKEEILHIADTEIQSALLPPILLVTLLKQILLNLCVVLKNKNTTGQISFIVIPHKTVNRLNDWRLETGDNLNKHRDTVVQDSC